MRRGLKFAAVAAFGAMLVHGDMHEDILLARVLARAAGNLQRLLNYTCLQTIERSRRPSAGTRWRPIDKVRIEVALVNGKEIFAWPGAGRFEDKELRDMAIGGATSTGNFGLLARSVFLSGTVTYHYAGELVLDGRRAYRWDYQVPQFRSGYTIRNGTREAVVGFHGSFWADASTLDVIRLESTADDIPAALELVSTGDAIDYQRLRVGEEEFLLPVTSELRMIDFGGENLNHTAFSQCHQYRGESVLILDDSANGEQINREPGREVAIPAGLSLRIALNDEVRSDAAVGDLLQGRLTAPLKIGGDVIVPKGAAVRGRIVWLRTTQDVASRHVIGMDFSEVSFGNSSGRVRGRLREVLSVSKNISMTPFDTTRTGEDAIANLFSAQVAALPGVVFARSGAVLIPAGLQMVWRTESPESEESHRDPVRTRN